jgi:hypothetical protein
LLDDLGGELRLSADEFAGGHLDWYPFDRARGTLGATGDLGEQTTVTTFLPTGVAFEGMPDPRCWKLEDRKTNFGAVKPWTTDLAHLLLMEFALVYADDWFVIPCRLPAGTLARVDGLVVTNTFGERLWVTGAGTGPEQDWHSWAMFQRSLAKTPTRAYSCRPRSPGRSTVPRSRRSSWRATRSPTWSGPVETTVSSVTGAGRSGRDEARDTLAYHEQLIPEARPCRRSTTRPASRIWP